jgi:hypothetical protein
MRLTGSWRVPVLSACNRKHLAETQRFELLGPQTLDHQTGLVRRRCSVGLAWQGKGCAGTAGCTEFRNTRRRPSNKLTAGLVDAPGTCPGTVDKPAIEDVAGWISGKFTALATCV